ncbi:MAG: glutamine--fructose-6-phosphate transaminase (isomerizing) [Flavobacteriales bacterium]|nr:glutamine--fructose-6-phosphate transaminase (isomerizing) [Flavobacteriales bacterium]|tara:strand:- start:865 stop:2706 length:1842 start_codon:yes stop_codon:yes gene_type:complete
MCGIVAYVGSSQAYPIIIKGLKRLEYRGYDSAGIALGSTSGTNIYKKKGKVSNLESYVLQKDYDGCIGIGHTRWATHGVPNEINAHPHTSGDKKLSLIHNGIIENHDSIKKALIDKGHVFESNTDTEVLVHLIEEIKNHENVCLFEAVRIALNEVVGAYAIVVFEEGINNEFIAARKGSPLLIGVGRNEYYVASDASPIIEYTNEVIYLKDGEIARLNCDENIEIKTIQNKSITPYIHELKVSLDNIEKGGFPHFMLKEIYEQPKSILDTMRGRINPENKEVKLGGILDFEKKIVNSRRIIIVACGTSWHAGLIGEYLFEDFARIPVEVEYASEFRYRNPIINEDDIVLAISQSGETADTLAALELAKEKGATILGVCNVVGSSIPRLTHAGIYTHAGPEIGVASTKAFTTQVVVLILMALRLGKQKGTLSTTDYHQIITELDLIPSKIEKVLNINSQIEVIAKQFKNATNFLYLGRGYNFPVALEGALKLKEISYIHAEGYPAAEMKHGPIALIDDKMPIVVIATKKGNYEKVVSNIQEVKARGGRIISVVTEGDSIVKELTDYCIEIPNCFEELSPLLTNIPLQLLSYHIAVLRGCDVDQPRNLAKSVTVE